MLARAKTALRIRTDAFDSEIEDLIESAKADLELIGIIADETDPLVRTAILTYVRINFGQLEDPERPKRAYDEQKAQLQISSKHKVVNDG